jgi:two-component system cell cycle sensor histidine kinase/response regulator CckA
VVQRIVEGLGGTIQFQTESGRGTSFRIRLPAAGEIAPAGNPSMAPPKAEEPDRTGLILAVEDEAPLRLAVAKVLRMNGFAVLEAADGTAALNLLREYRGAIAVVLLDITLPGAPSVEVFAEARRLQPEANVILTSAYGRLKVDELFPGMEIDAFLRKPYQLADLIDAVRGFISQRSEMSAR